jgi:hypothetical protein
MDSCGLLVIKIMKLQLLLAALAALALTTRAADLTGIDAKCAADGASVETLTLYLADPASGAVLRPETLEVATLPVDEQAVIAAALGVLNGLLPSGLAPAVINITPEGEHVVSTDDPATETVEPTVTRPVVHFSCNAVASGNAAAVTIPLDSEDARLTDELRDQLLPIWTAFQAEVAPLGLPTP